MREKILLSKTSRESAIPLQLTVYEIFIYAYKNYGAEKKKKLTRLEHLNGHDFHYPISLDYSHLILLHCV